MAKTLSTAASKKPSPRVLSLGALMLVIWAITELNNGLDFHETWNAIFWLMFSPLVAWFWVGWTMVCLRELGLSRLWVLPILLPPVALAVSFHEKWTIFSLVALVVMLAAQIAIAARKPASDPNPTEITSSGRPPA